MENIGIEKNRIGGELLRKAVQNSARMHTELYDSEHCFKDEGYLWHGDWEGRTILSFVRLWQVLKTKPEHLDAIMAKLDEKLNEGGYFGPVLDESSINEQQLAGNSWFLRGLCEYYRKTGDERVLERIARVVGNLYLPIGKYLGAYPLVFTETSLGEKSGGIVDKHENWRLSSDIGCMFIALDGLSDTYALLKTPELLALIEEILAINFRIDKVANNYQTHASLTCARGVLRMYRCTGKREYLDYVSEIFRLYTEKGMSFAYGNYNWFNRGEWTEPCAIVDSMMIADELYRITGRAEYLDILHRIYYNAFVFAQRDNGGFGCDSCVKYDFPYLAPDFRFHYEAFWCCTMRAAEGFFCIAEGQWKKQGDDVYCCFYNPSELCEEGLRISLHTDYPESGEIVADVCTDRTRNVNFYIPKNADFVSCGCAGAVCENGFVRCPVNGKTKFSVVFRLKTEKESVGRGMYRILSGERMLGTLDEEKQKQIGDRFTSRRFEGKTLYPVLDLSKLTFDELKDVKQKLIFEE